ncbi:MAG TPA: hydrogenase expression/formation protein HypE [Gemmatimonadaceae bacterium]|jgi:hydrogenase expression/formation protein HypE
MSQSVFTDGLVCPAPIAEQTHVLLGHGSGGKLSAALVRDYILPHFANTTLQELGDAAIVDIGFSRLAFSTDAFVVNPLEFPGGDIGVLAVHGTLNDLAMMGAEPRYIAVSLILEEGFELGRLQRIIASMARAATAAHVTIVTGDTKVVERGKADGLFITTTGIGVCDSDFRTSPTQARVGDAVLISGPMGAHGMTIMSAREGLGLDTELTSDSANLYPLVRHLRRAVGDDLHVMRDPTRGGVASAVNEIAAASRVGIELLEETLPIDPVVSAACEMLGLDPLYVANEGVLVAFVPESRADAALSALRTHPLGARSCQIGRVVEDNAGSVWMRTTIGGSRLVDLLPGDQLPRIC